MSNEMNCCRLCSTYTGEKIRYSSRHYAHAACGLKKWGADFFKKLHLWQLNDFPYFVAKDHGVEKDLEQAIATHPEGKRSA